MIIFQIYKESTFVHPSLCEGLSFVLMQALSAGLPVICTDKTGGKILLKMVRQVM